MLHNCLLFLVVIFLINNKNHFNSKKSIDFKTNKNIIILFITDIRNYLEAILIFLFYFHYICIQIWGLPLHYLFNYHTNKVH